MLENLRKYKILLGSKSPRRRELLAKLRIPFNVVAISNLEESYPPTLRAVDVPEYLSLQKASAYRDTIKDDEMVITADTVVILDGKIYGKPHSIEEAVEMLMTLSGRTHQVVTGVTVSTCERTVSFSCTTDVEFAELAREDAVYYIETYHPLDKAGAYGIQEWIGCVAVLAIYGSYYNVMGLPVHQLYEVLKTF